MVTSIYFTSQDKAILQVTFETEQPINKTIQVLDSISKKQTTDTVTIIQNLCDLGAAISSEEAAKTQNADKLPITENKYNISNPIYVSPDNIPDIYYGVAVNLDTSTVDIGNILFENTEQEVDFICGNNLHILPVIQLIDKIPLDCAAEVLKNMVDDSDADTYFIFNGSDKYYSIMKDN